MGESRVRLPGGVVREWGQGHRLWGDGKVGVVKPQNR
uniref:Uncharacterized protein n=1 Tax=Anguilla anguilla TaxID=7936 RepID=A0A0E9RPQ5_ANGAN